jgi:hypothetical protein
VSDDQSHDDVRHSPSIPVDGRSVGIADCLARAIARGVYEATALPYANAQPAWRDRFGEGG